MHVALLQHVRYMPDFQSELISKYKKWKRSSGSAPKVQKRKRKRESSSEESDSKFDIKEEIPEDAQEGHSSKRAATRRRRHDSPDLKVEIADDPDADWEPSSPDRKTKKRHTTR